MMRPQIVMACLLLAAQSSYGAESVVFNPVSDAPTQLDTLAREHFGKRYKVVEFSIKDHAWAFPKVVGEHRPPPPVYLENRCISGQTLVVYVISIEGRVMDAYAAKSTSDLLGALAVQLMSERRFSAGQLDGRPVPSLAATNFRFPCPGAEAK